MNEVYVCTYVGGDGGQGGGKGVYILSGWSLRSSVVGRWRRFGGSQVNGGCGVGVGVLTVTGRREGTKCMTKRW